MNKEISTARLDRHVELIHALKEIATLYPKLPLCPLLGNKRPLGEGWQKRVFLPYELATLLEKKELFLPLKGETKNLTSQCEGFGVITGLPFDNSGDLLICVDQDGTFPKEKLIELMRTDFSFDTPTFTSGKVDRCQYMFRISADQAELIKTTKLKCGENTETGKEDQLEFRFTGCQSCLPPSTHPETGEYQWVAGLETPILPLPPELLSVVLKPTTPPPIEVQSPVTQFVVDKGKTPPPHTPKPRKNKGWEDYLESFEYTSQPIPLLGAIAPVTRDLVLTGTTSGSRDDTGIAVAKDLIGTASFLDNVGQGYDGDTYSLLEDFCRHCSPPLSDADCSRIFNSAASSNPQPALDEYKLKTKIAAYFWKEDKPQRKDAVQGTEEGTEDEVTKAIKDLVGDDLKFNLLKNTIETEFKLNRIYLKLKRNYRLKVLKAEAYDTAVEIAQDERAYHPVKDYLESVRTHPQVDITKLATALFGTKNPIYDEFVFNTLIAAVARIYQPGCKFDNVLVLKGAQHCMKSTFFLELFGRDWFTDSVNLTEKNAKDTLLTAHQHWCCELAELETMTTKRECGELKKWFSKRDDNFRKPYEAESHTYLRQHIYVATCNEDTFLTDSTGDRRYWIIPITSPINIADVKKYRDAIWSAALAHYEGGAKWWFDHLKEDYVMNLNVNYRVSDTWSEVIEDWLLVNKYDRATTNDILAQALDIPVQHISTGHTRRLQRCMSEINWKPSRYYHLEGGIRKRVRGYISHNFKGFESDDMDETGNGTDKTDKPDRKIYLSYSENPTPQGLQNRGTDGTDKNEKKERKKGGGLNDTTSIKDGCSDYDDTQGVDIPVHTPPLNICLKPSVPQPHLSHEAETHTETAVESGTDKMASVLPVPEVKNTETYTDTTFEGETDTGTDTETDKKRGENRLLNNGGFESMSNEVKGKKESDLTANGVSQTVLNNGGFESKGNDNPYHLGNGEAVDIGDYVHFQRSKDSKREKGKITTLHDGKRAFCDVVTPSGEVLSLTKEQILCGG
jgi:predicted P-loop ATPase